MSLQHRGGRVPLRLALSCWWEGHRIERLPSGRVRCTRCERLARTPVELP